MCDPYNNHRDRLGGVIPLGKIVTLPDYFSLFFQKTWIKDSFKFTTVDFDIRME